MNSLQIELDKINQQLEHLTFRKNQLEPIIAEYNDTLERVKRLTDNMIALNIEPTNLRFDIEDILEGNEAGEWCSEPDIFASEDEPDTTPEPQPGQDFPSDWMQVTEAAHSQSEPTETEQATESEDYDSFYPELTPEPTPQPVKMFAFVPVPTFEPKSKILPESELTTSVGNYHHLLPKGTYWKSDILKLFIPRKSRYRKELEAICQTCSTIFNLQGSEIYEVEDNWLVILSPVYDCSIPFVIDEFYPNRKDWTEETPKPTEAPEPKLTQLNLQAYRRGDDVLVIGFSSKRLMNTWTKWFKTTWSDSVHISDHSDNLQGFNHCLTILWYGSPNWERLTKLNYSLKPTEQNAIAYHQQQVANSEEE